MKSMKLIVIVGLMSGFASAATVTVSSGLTAQGYTVLVSGVAPVNFQFAVGSWDVGTSTWTQFGTSLVDTAKVGGIGGIIATSPASLQTKPIDLFVGIGANIASSGSSWVILRSTNAATLFPADITTATGVTWAATNTNAVTFLAKGDPANGFTAPVGTTGGFLNLVPEPSAALLGALGALGLLRRRRI